MPQARYARINVGHFGLASRSYCHFTSPIRRYADLLVHRALKHVLGLDGGMFPVGERLDRVADGLNQQERNAMDCEREMDKRLACLWMKRQDTDAVWSGTVSSVLSFGLFVELDAAPVEGLVSLPSLGGDWFEYDERRQRLVGEMTGVVWQVGTPLAVRCVRADPASLQVDFMPASNGDAAKQRAVDRPRLSRGRKKSGRTRSGCSTSVLPYGKRPKGGRKDSCRKDRVGKRTRGKPHLEAENSCSAVAGRAAKTPDLAVSKSRRNKDVAARGKKARRRSGYAASEVEEFIRQLDASDKN